jgi:hypothetical protein
MATMKGRTEEFLCGYKDMKKRRLEYSIFRTVRLNRAVSCGAPSVDGLNSCVFTPERQISLYFPQYHSNVCVLVFWKVQGREPSKHECCENVVEGNVQRDDRIRLEFNLLLFLLSLLAVGLVHYLYPAYSVATIQKKHKIIRLVGRFIRICTQIFFTALCGTQSTNKGRVDSHDAR